MTLRRRRSSRPPIALPLASLVILAGCASGAAASASPTAASTSPSAAPNASATARSSDGTGGVIVTIRVIDETYRIRLVEPADIAVARDLLAGREGPRIPNGRVVRGDDGGVNTGYSWHIDPHDVEWADVTTEVCDGTPSDVERGTITSDRFCPWSAAVVAIEPAE